VTNDPTLLSPTEPKSSSHHIPLSSLPTSRSKTFKVIASAETEERLLLLMQKNVLASYDSINEGNAATLQERRKFYVLSFVQPYIYFILYINPLLFSQAAYVYEKVVKSSANTEDLPELVTGNP
jgi:hypothetical protein